MSDNDTRQSCYLCISPFYFGTSHEVYSDWKMSKVNDFRTETVHFLDFLDPFQKSFAIRNGPFYFGTSRERYFVHKFLRQHITLVDQFHSVQL